ncbi:MAG: PilT/PilU family type 4a pilus ATPase [Eubacteriales bacterium]|nr:PilT/PilU family type 4a pilus ATPase [Eubacteriales bacterium]
MKISAILENFISEDVSDIFIIAGRPISYRKNDKICSHGENILMPEDTNQLISEIYTLAHRDMNMLVHSGDDDFSFAIPGQSRFRVNAYKQRSSLAAVIRVIRFELPDYKSLFSPDDVINTGNLPKGLVLVTGPAGSGKSTTLACIIDNINHTADKHIVTLEDPIEYLYRHDRSIVTQREIQTDTQSYIQALRAALRQSPDVILLGEMRDYETIDVATTAAETGHLIFSTLHTLGAVNTIERIIDTFPANQQSQMAMQLSLVLQVIISQQFVPDINGNLVPAFEILTLNPGIRNMIRDNKLPQIDGILYSSMNDPTMISMDTYLINMMRKGIITKETAIMYSTNPEMLKKRLI